MGVACVTIPVARFGDGDTVEVDKGNCDGMEFNPLRPEDVGR
jgi:hypothetical protein